MPEIVYALLALILLFALALVVIKIANHARMLQQLSSQVADMLEQKHRAMLTDLHGGLAQQSDRVTSRLSEELNQTRDSLHRLQLSLAMNLGETTEKLNAKIDGRLDDIAGRGGGPLRGRVSKKQRNLL